VLAAHSHMAATTRDSSSVILVQRSAGWAQALLIRRHADLAFGGSWVFPGGKLEPSDGTADTLAILGIEAARPEIAPLMVGACRETFEETGIVLARRPDGEFCDPQLADSLQPFRTEVSQNPSRFVSLLAEHDLKLDASRLLYWSHWITPSVMPKRFDTRFFVSEMPPNQSILCDSAEATDHLWFDLPKDGTLPDESVVTAPPTRFSLGELGRALNQHKSLDRLMRAEATRVVYPVMPKILRNGKESRILLPWDSEYPGAPGEGTTEIPPGYLAFPSRFESPKFLAGRPLG
jgi:8-oxo-dGTP pyrophosphatase MutT (NUDIX family)